MAKRRVLLVDDEVTVLLTMKAILEISGFDVDTAASAREGKSKIKLREYQMVITDMRMESEAAGLEVIHAARTATYRPAIALLTAFPMSDEAWEGPAPDKMLVKPMQTKALLQQLEKLLTSHETKKGKLKSPAEAPAAVAGGAKQGAAADSERPLRKKPAKKTTAKVKNSIK